MPVATLPTVPVGHAELRDDNSAATIDGASDRAKGAPSLPNREFNRTRCYLRELSSIESSDGNISFKALWPIITHDTNLLLDPTLVS